MTYNVDQPGDRERALAQPLASTIGIVVIGRNEGDRLIRCIESLRCAARHIVYVDSGSTDGSSSNARSLGGEVVQLDLARPFTAARARNEGFARLIEILPGARYVQFIDGDCELDSQWLASASRFLDSHDDVAVVCGRRSERFPERSIYNRLCDTEWNTPVGEASACGGDALMRVSAFTAAGGFNVALMAGEEPELCARLRQGGWRIWRLDAPMTLHDAAMTRLKQWWRRSMRSGFGYAQAWRATRNLPVPLYRRETIRALIWAGLLPVATLLLSLALPWAVLIGIGIVALQIARGAARRGLAERFSWQYSGLMMLAKIPELQGIVKFFLLARTTVISSIQYK